jgi:peptidoglycan/LPS O-acetylase OafA/YrhL
MFGASLGERLRAGGNEAVGLWISTFTASGVELFFVLSAIVLVRPFMNGRPFVFLRYVQRRFERLLPPYWVAWFLSGLSVYLATRFPTWWTEGANLPSFTVHDWAAQFGLVYFGGSAFNFAWWSLTVEVLFYMLVPVLIPVMLWAQKQRGRRAAIFIVSLALAVLADLGAIGFPDGREFYALRSLAIYSSCFASGLLLAQRLPSPRTSAWLAAVGAFWVLLSTLGSGLNIHVGWGLLYFGLVAQALRSRSRLSRQLQKPLFIWLGERSYSLFLTHYAVIVFVCHLASFTFEQKGFGYFATTRIAAIFVSLLIAMLVFHLVERRFAHNLITAGHFWPPMRTGAPFLRPVPAD